MNPVAGDTCLEGVLLHKQCEHTHTQITTKWFGVRHVLGQHVGKS